MWRVVVISCALLCHAGKVRWLNESCGVDRAIPDVGNEGVASIDEYPWMGTLYYDRTNNILTTSVILVTKQIVLASAQDIDKIPKIDIREKTRVVLGSSCDGPSIRIREYTYHPEYRRSTYNALAMVQLETDTIKQVLIPICAPPNFVYNPTYYVMRPSNECKRGKLLIRKMVYIDLETCKEYYRKIGLDNAMSWPLDATCAHALRGGNCVWRSGTALALKQQGRWHLLGFGMHGPGCQAPARFTDIGAAAPWLRRTAARAGRGLPAVTRLGKNHLVLRRSSSNLQRFGECEEEETKYELYTDEMNLRTDSAGHTYYNLTLVSQVEYSCIVFRTSSSSATVPRINLRHGCIGPPKPCYGIQFMEIHFVVEIEYEKTLNFAVKAYGKPIKFIDPKQAMALTVHETEHPDIYFTYWHRGSDSAWFYPEDVTYFPNMDPTHDRRWEAKNHNYG